jgi:hypothetical protein
MDLFAKVGLLLVVMAVLYLLARGSAEPAESATFTPTLAPDRPTPSLDPGEEELAVRPREEGGTRIDNYGFRKTDLRTGPADPEDFYDELLVSFYSEDTGNGWQTSYTVCTPKGLARYMRETGFNSLLVNAYLVVERYDVDLILKTILEPVEDAPDPPDGMKDPDVMQDGTFRTRW